MATGGGSSFAIPVIDLPPSASGLKIDSKGRNRGESPYNFQCQLSAGISSDLLTYQAFQWNQPLYSHTGVTSAFVFDLLQEKSPTFPYAAVNQWQPAFSNGGNFLRTHYVIYHKPYQSWTQFDGNEGSGDPFQVPQPGSYGSDVETALNGDVRINTNNLVPVDLTTIWPSIQFTFRYSSSQGYLLQASYIPPDDDVRVNIPLRIFDCPSIRNSHKVHGFGVKAPWNPLDINTGSIQTAQQTAGNNQIWLPAWLAVLTSGYVQSVQSLIANGGVNLSSPTMGRSYAQFSDSTPTLISQEYIQIWSPELTYQRSQQSYRNTTASAPYGNNELALFPVSIAYTGRFVALEALTDANVWSLREGYAPQQVRMIVTDEDGKDLTVSQCFNNFFRAPIGINADANVFQLPFVDVSVNFRSSASMNYLLFGIANESPPNGFFEVTAQWGDPAAVSLETDVVHLLQALNV